MKLSKTIATQLFSGIVLYSCQAFSADAQSVGSACAKMHAGETAETINDCIRKNLKPNKKITVPDDQPMLNQPGKLTINKTTPSGGGSGDKSPQADESTVDPTKGCPYLVITKNGLTHSKGIKGCLGEKSMVCDMKGKNSAGQFIYGWHVVSETSCISGYRDLATIERNAENLRQTNEKLTSQGE